MSPNWTQAEGFILGVGAKTFTIVGPVIVYGFSTSVVYGLLIVGNVLRLFLVVGMGMVLQNDLREYTFVMGNACEKKL